MENQQSITLQDLDGLRNIIDLASQRGAFRASEMQQVGELYNKLSNFLDAVVTQAQTESTTGSDEPQGE
jgi:hypothetical protein